MATSLNNIKLRKARKLLGITQLQVAEDLGIGQSAISAMEQGKNDISVHYLRFLYRNGIDLNSLLDEKGTSVRRIHSPAVTISELKDDLCNLAAKIQKILEK